MTADDLKRAKEFLDSSDLPQDKVDLFRDIITQLSVRMHLELGEKMRVKELIKQLEGCPLVAGVNVTMWEDIAAQEAKLLTKWGRRDFDEQKQSS